MKIAWISKSFIRNRRKKMSLSHQGQSMTYLECIDYITYKNHNLFFFFFNWFWLCRGHNEWNQGGAQNWLQMSQIYKKDNKEDWGKHKPLNFTLISGKAKECILLKSPLLHVFPGMCWTVPDWEEPAWILKGQTKHDWPDCFLWWIKWTCRRGKSSGWFLHWF